MMYKLLKIYWEDTLVATTETVQDMVTWLNLHPTFDVDDERLHIKIVLENGLTRDVHFNWFDR